MNTKRLAQMYDRLTVWERIPLLIAADAREDGAEYRRLFDSSPLRHVQLSEHLLAELALHVLTLIYVGEQLNAAASYFFSLFQMKIDPRPEDWLLSADANAYFFTVNSEAWRRLCGDLGLAPAVLTASNHRGWFLGYCEEHMPARAPSAESLQARWRDSGRDASASVVTADSLLAGWRHALQTVCRHAQNQRPQQATT